MLMTQRMFLILVFYITSITDGYAVLMKKQHVGSECGVLSYISKRDPACGIEKYREGADWACGAKKYNSGSGAVCGTTCSKRCTKRIPIVKTCIYEETNCTYNTCEHSGFGVKEFHRCRNSQFGVEMHKTCSKQEFGVDRFKSCTLYMTKSEVIAYIAATKALIPEYSSVRASKQGDVLTYGGLKNDLACLIRHHENDPFSSQLVSDLKTKYLIHFLESVESNTFDCTQQDQSAELLAFKETCKTYSSEEVKSGGSSFDRACAAEKAINIIDAWFKDRISAIDLLIKDVVANGDSLIRSDFEDLLEQLAHAGN